MTVSSSTEFMAGFLGEKGFELGVFLMGLSSVAGLIHLQRTGVLSWRLYHVALSSAVLAAASYFLAEIAEKSSFLDLVTMELPRLALLAGLFANGYWTKGRFQSLDSNLDASERRALTVSMGRRLWSFPLVLSAIVSALLLLP